MFTMDYATPGDEAFWLALDRRLAAEEFRRKVRDRRAYILRDGQRPVGVLRYNLMWDEVPFLTLLCLAEADRGRGFGRLAVQQWEREMQSAAHAVVMTSTVAGESAQHFYRKLGYCERGSLFLDNTPLAQPPELLMLKVL